MPYATYMVASISGVLYVGVTNDLFRRVSEHHSGALRGFSQQYHCHRLVWYETFDDVRVAIAREKNQRLAPSQEGCAGDGYEPGLARPVGRPERLKAIPRAGPRFLVATAPRNDIQ